MIEYKDLFGEEFFRTSGNFEECYAFSIHKCGSTLMHNMISQVCREAHISAVSIPDTLFMEGMAAEEWDSDSRLLKLIKTGRIYYGFRHLPDVLLDPQIDLYNKRVVLLVRDPRDALVSAFYSFGGKHRSHRFPDKNRERFLANANRAVDVEIDQYVIRSARRHLNKMIKYKNNLNFDNVMLRKYEEIYFDKKSFLRDIFTHFGFTVSLRIIERVARDNDKRPVKEDMTKHIRKGTPGDHREKLRPETIEQLNDIFSDICDWYGYSLR